MYGDRMKLAPIIDPSVRKPSPKPVRVDLRKVFMVGTSLWAVGLVICMILLALGFDAGALDVFLYRALPCALYDCVIGLVLYPLAARVLAGAAPAQPGTPRLR